MGILGALTAALAWGTDSVLAREGLRKVPPALGTFISLCASLIVCLIALALSGPGRYPLHGVLWFMMVGVCNFLVGRQCNFRSTQRLGQHRILRCIAIGRMHDADVLPSVAPPVLQPGREIFEIRSRGCGGNKDKGAFGSST